MSPRGLAAAAVVERPEHQAAGWIGGRAHPVVTCGGPSTVIGVVARTRRFDVLSSTVTQRSSIKAISTTLTPWAAISTATRASAMSAKPLRSGRATPGNITSGLVYSWLTHKSPRGLVERKEGDVVVVVAEALGLLAGSERLRVERRQTGNERIAPADQHLGVVALRHVMALVDARGQLAEGVAHRGSLQRPGP